MKSNRDRSSLLGEIVSSRAENRKVFRCSTGMREAVIYDHPVHFKENGAWHAIDNTVKEYKDKTGSPRYSNTASPLFITLPQKTGRGAYAELTVKGKTLRVEPEGLSEAAAEVEKPAEEKTRDEALLYPANLC